MNVFRHPIRSIGAFLTIALIYYYALKAPRAVEIISGLGQNAGKSLREFGEDMQSVERRVK